ncbi:MAG: hypothetical protein IJR85_10805 [Synergistaceae bacterium]|nr:hypothetical protein [Synergistaceae bacterium]
MKEQNFISAVVYSDKYSPANVEFVGKIASCLEEHFMHYEIIVIISGTEPDLHEELITMKKGGGISFPVSVVNMPLEQSKEQCMNAGLDMSIGDYVYEFDSAEGGYDFGLIWEAYEEAQRGNDIVSVCPRKENIMSRMFYRVFNAHSGSIYPLRTNAFRLVSRRALNRAHALNVNLAYRKAVYASIGLKMAEIYFDGTVMNNAPDKVNLAVDSLVLYTAFGYRFSLRFAAVMMLITLAELVYTVVVWVIGRPVSGWTTMMFVMTLGLTGMFGILAVTLKYLALIVKLLMNRQNYLIESIEKL